jgi:shikimate dehydrogenase
VTHASIQEIVCVFGQPVAGNPTQYMMEKAFAEAGLDWRYLTLEVAPADLADAVRGMRAMGFRGGNLTVPHKVAVLPLLDGLSPAAERMGAVNTIHREGSKLLGENTDGKGFVESLRGVTDPAGKKIVVLGAGGAARAIAVELALAGAAEITIVNRTPERGQALAAVLVDKLQANAAFAPWQGEYQAPEAADVIVNATSIGLNAPQARVPLALASLRPHHVVADVVFNPANTRLLREARDQGCTTLDGLGMLVNQAVTAFRLWTRREPNAALMRDAVEEFLGV